MLSVIKNILIQFINDIDANNTNLTYEQLCKVLRILNNIKEGDVAMSKQTAADYIGVCRSTFDNYVRDGYIPKGVKEEGFKELRWYKSDLDLYLNNIL